MSPPVLLPALRSPARGDEIEIHLGSLDAPDQFRLTYELWTTRREAWLPPFALDEHYERDRPDDRGDV